MAKAQWTSKSGTKVIIEGTTDEVANLLGRLDGVAPRAATTSPPAQRVKHSRARKVLTSPAGLISELAETGFFATPKELNAIKVTLEEQGHFYPITTLSPTLLRLVRKRQLRRIKEKGRWVYVA